MTTWKRIPQEREGGYLFSGTLLVTQGALACLSPEDILSIYLDIQAWVKEKGGIDYFQVYENDAGEKLYFIDECSPEMMKDPSFQPEYNRCTLLLPHEY